MKKIIALAPLALALAGCAIGPDYARPTLDLPTGYAEKAGAEISLPDKWWTLYGDATLNELMTVALERNADIAEAVGRIEETDALLREAGAAFLPEIDAGLAGNRSRVSAATAFPNPPPLVRNDVRLALSTSFEIDFWGRLRRLQEAARAQALSSRYAREVVGLSTTSLVAQTYFSVRFLDLQISIAQDSFATRELSYKLAVARTEKGLASDLDTNQARGSLSDARVLLRDLLRQRELADHLLAVLTGRPGATLAPAPRFSFTLPALPALGLPSALLERRPDVRQAEQALVAANAQIGVAKAAYFPTISLSANDGGESTALASIMKSGARIWSAGLTGTAPLLDFGRTSARVEEAQARESQALAAYRKSAETAYREVADALSGLHAARESVAELEVRAETSRDSLRIVQARYEAGYSGFLDVLDAQRTANDANLALVKNRLAEVSSGIDLIKALGGGWGTTAP